LDHPRCGAVFLRQREIAGMVVEALFEGERRFGRYELHSFVVMPNPVHLLVTPHVPARVWLGALKGFTGYTAIRMFDLITTPFWQAESYDHLVRDDEECARVRRYIEWKPVKAGLAASPEAFLWSSATRGGSPAAGRKA
jgi:putative transposase